MPNTAVVPSVRSVPTHDLEVGDWAFIKGSNGVSVLTLLAGNDASGRSGLFSFAEGDVSFVTPPGTETLALKIEEAVRINLGSGVANMIYTKRPSVTTGSAYVALGYKGTTICATRSSDGEPFFFNFDSGNWLHEPEEYAYWTTSFTIECKVSEAEWMQLYTS